MVDEAPWRVLTDSLCSSIPDKCAQPLNVKAVDETSVLNRLRVCNDFSRVDAAEFTSEEIDLLLGGLWRTRLMHLPLHRTSVVTAVRCRVNASWVEILNSLKA
jgi:Mg2+/Co2+ transporter CorC